MTPQEIAARRDAQRRARMIRWPDGPVCPYCGERERVVVEAREGDARLRYECQACEAHRGYFRRPKPSNEPSEDAPSPRPVVPRFPSGG